MKKSNGITLIALVITIIVLLILAGISIATLTGENGVLTKAENAKNLTIKGEEKEQISLAYNTAIAEKLEKGEEIKIVAGDLQTQLDNQNANATAVDKRNKIEVTFQKTSNQYTVNGSNGKIEEAKEEIPISFEVNGVEFKANLRRYMGGLFWFTNFRIKAKTISMGNPLCHTRWNFLCSCCWNAWGYTCL